jgi:hypothetical protein
MKAAFDQTEPRQDRAQPGHAQFVAGQFRTGRRLWARGSGATSGGQTVRTSCASR